VLRASIGVQNGVSPFGVAAQAESIWRAVSIVGRHTLAAMSGWNSRLILRVSLSRIPLLEQS
jgi:hypothetical protein